MAARLQQHLAGGVAGFSDALLVYNRTTAVAERFAAATPGCRVVKTVAELAAAAPAVVFSMLANDQATDAVLAEYLAALKATPAAADLPPLFVNAATVLPSTVARQAADAAAAGVLYANCPVFGRPDAAAVGSLVAVPAGAPAARERLAPLLPAFAGGHAVVSGWGRQCDRCRAVVELAMADKCTQQQNEALHVLSCRARGVGPWRRPRCVSSIEAHGQLLDSQPDRGGVAVPGAGRGQRHRQ